MTKKMLLCLVLAISMVVTFAVPSFASSVDTNYYNFTTEYDETKGSVSLSLTKAMKGNVITCYVNPDSGYLVDTITITNVSTGDPVRYTQSGDEYQFSMPASDVKIAVTFGESDGAYATRLIYDDDLGDVTLSQNGADYLDYVTVYVEPYTGTTYSRSEGLVIIRTDRDTEVTYTYEGKSDGVYEYEFRMPKSDVEIEVLFDDEEDDDDDDIGEYDIDIDVSHSNRGDAWTLVDSADEGKIVKIYTDASTGYYVSKVAVVTAGDDDVSCYGNEDSYFYFIMPDDDVDILVTFKAGSGSSSSSSGRFDIDILDYDEDLGEIWTEVDSADQYDRVIIYHGTAKGVTIDDIIVLDDDGDEVEVKYNNLFYYFNMPLSDVTIEVVFAGEPTDGPYEGTNKTIRLIYDDEYGYAYTNFEDTDPERGDRVKVYVEPDRDYEVGTVSVSKTTGGEVSVYKTSGYWYFSMPNSDVIVTVVFVDEDGESTSSSSSSYYDIDVDYNDDFGEVEIDDEARSGRKVEFYVDGWVDDIRVIRLSDGRSVTVKEGSDDGEYYFTMPSSNVYVDVLFDEDVEGNDYEIEVDAKSSRGTVELSSYEADEGDMVKIYVEPKSGYDIETVKVYKGTKKVTTRFINDFVYYFTMPDDDVEVTVTFTTAVGDYSVKTSYTSTQGTVTATPTTADSGDLVDVTVTAKSGYKIKSVTAKKANGSSVTLDDEGSGNYSFVMPASDVTVTATFEANVVEYTIQNISDASFGTVTVPAKSQKSKTVSITATPKSGYTVNTVTVTDASGKSVSVTKGTSAWTFTMPASNVKVNVTFKQAAVDYFVTTTYEKTQGTVTVSPTKAQKDTTVTVTPNANTGYTVESVKAVNAASNASLAITKNGDTYSFKMPAANAKVTVTFKAAVHDCAAKKFSDLVVTEWYHDAVDYVLTKGIMNGMGGDIFAPSTTVTRGMVTTVLWRIADQPISTAALPYTDVAAGQWYTEAIRWAAANGILTNVSNTTVFEPDATITREQFATMIYRFEQYKAGGNLAKPADQISKFSDKASVSDWAVDALNWCGANSVINGNANGTLDPQGSTTRAQLAQILYNYRSFN